MSLLELLNLSSTKKVEIFDDAVRYIFTTHFSDADVPPELETKTLQSDRDYAKWSPREDSKLYEEIGNDKTITEIAILHQRTKGAIVARLKKYALELHLQGEDIETIVSSTLLTRNQVKAVIENNKKEPETLTKITKPKTSLSNKKEYTEDLTLDQERSFDALKKWRNQVSKDLEWPAYMVLSNAVLKSIAFYQPKTDDELLLIKGMGSEKVGRYSDAIISIVNKNHTARLLLSKQIPQAVSDSVFDTTDDCDDQGPVTYIPPIRFLK